MIRRIAFSEKATTFEGNLQNCLDRLNSMMKQARVVGAVFFIDTNSDADYFSKKKKIVAAVDALPFQVPYNVLSQANEFAVALELLIEESKGTIEYLTFKDIRYTRFTGAYGKELWGLGVTSPVEGCSIPDQIEFSFEMMQQLLLSEGMDLSDTVRQWNYIPGIVDIQKTEDGKTWQHYQVFNEIRQRYYAPVRFQEGYPAATGISSKTGNFTLDFFAIQSSPFVRKISLSNPKQQDAYEYAQYQLIGDPMGSGSKKPPLFERAKLLQKGNDITGFISGTAAIVGQETIGNGDVRIQTEVAIDNIFRLVGPENTEDKTGKKKLTFTYLRVYIKNKADFPAVIDVCESRFGDLSVSYIQADICRKDLLVEIEGEVAYV